MRIVTGRAFVHWVRSHKLIESRHLTSKAAIVTTHGLVLVACIVP